MEITLVLAEAQRTAGYLLQVFGKLRRPSAFEITNLGVQATRRSFRFGFAQ
jgi:hypothetical protein